jgi:nucleoside-diphosphate-sugar epimerase
MIPAFVYKLTHNWNLSSDKAKQELGYSFIDLETGLKKTIHWIES